MLCALLVFSACEQDKDTPVAGDEPTMERRSGGSVPAHVTMYPSTSAAETELQNFYNFVVKTQNVRQYGTRDLEESVWVLEAYANYNFADGGSVAFAGPVDTFDLFIPINSTGESGPSELNTAWQDVIDLAQEVNDSLQTNQLIHGFDVTAGDAVYEETELIGYNSTVVAIVGLTDNPSGNPQYMITYGSDCSPSNIVDSLFWAGSKYNSSGSAYSNITEWIADSIQLYGNHYKTADRAITRRLYNGDCIDQCAGVPTNVQYVFDSGQNTSDIFESSDTTEQWWTTFMLQTYIDGAIDVAETSASNLTSDHQFLSAYLWGDFAACFDCFSILHFYEGHSAICRAMELDIPKYPLE